jgi:hypothetical protein
VTIPAPSIYHASAGVPSRFRAASGSIIGSWRCKPAKGSFSRNVQSGVGRKTRRQWRTMSCTLQVHHGQGSEQRRRAPPLDGVLRNVTVEPSNATSCNSRTTPKEHRRGNDQPVDDDRVQTTGRPHLPCSEYADRVTHAATPATETTAATAVQRISLSVLMRFSRPKTERRVPQWMDGETRKRAPKDCTGRVSLLRPGGLPAEHRLPAGLTVRGSFTWPAAARASAGIRKECTVCTV